MPGPAAALTSAKTPHKTSSPTYRLAVTAITQIRSSLGSFLGMDWCIDAVAWNSALIKGLDGHGLAKGCNMNFDLLQATEKIEVVRLCASHWRCHQRACNLSFTPAGFFKLRWTVNQTIWMKPRAEVDPMNQTGVNRRLVASLKQRRRRR